MLKARGLLILGVWLALLPYLGFPYSWKDVLTTLSGIGLIFFSYMFYHEYRLSEAKRIRIKEETFDNFSENKFEETKKTDDVRNQ